MTNLILRPTTLTNKPHIRWALQFRWHDLSGTDYQTIARVSDATAETLVDAGSPYFLFGDSDRRLDWRDELSALEPEQMTEDQLRAEVVRLRSK